MNLNVLKQHIPYLTLITLLLFIGFSPAIFSIYLYHDDVFFWAYPSASGKIPNIVEANIYYGRYLAACILWLLFFVVDTISDLNKLRLISVFLIIGFSFFVYQILFKYLKNSLEAALCAVIIFTLPGFEITVAYSILITNILAIMFALFAIDAADRLSIEGRVLNRINSWHTYFAVLMIVMSNMVYYPMATFYWPIAAILLIKEAQSGWILFVEKSKNIFIVGLSGILIYAVICKIIGFFINYSFRNDYNFDQINLNVIKKFSFFFQEVIPKSLNLWNIFGGVWVPCFCCVFLLGAIILFLNKISREIKTGELLKRILVCFAIFTSLLFLSYLPNLISVVDLNVYRCNIGLMTLELVFLLWGLKIYSASLFRNKFFVFLLILICFYGVYSCYRNIDRYRVQPSHQEYVLVKKALEGLKGQSNQIFIVNPQRYDQMYSQDEFFLLTATFDNQNLMFINSVLNEIASQESLEWIGFEGNIISRDMKYVYRDQRSKVFYTLKLKIFEDEKMLDQLKGRGISIINLKQLADEGLHHESLNKLLKH